MTTTRPRPPRALAATLLLSLVAGPLTSAPRADAAGGDGGDPPPPPLRVSVSDVVVPRYSDDLTFTVASTGTDPTAVISYGGQELASQELKQDDTFSIPTTGVFKPGTSYRLDVEVYTEASEGSSSVTFEPTPIVATVTPSGTSVPFSSPLYGVLTANRPTPVVPSGGDMVLRHDGVVRATYPIRTDGTFALRDATMLPGVYRNAHVLYTGDEAYGETFFGAGMWIGDLTITTMPTTTTAALTDGEVVAGDDVDVLASVASSHPDTTADVAGELVVSAAPLGSEDFAEVARTAYPGGKVAVEVPLDDFVDTHSGAWTIRTAYTGSTVAAPSVGTDRTLTIGRAGATATSTTLDVAPASPTAYGAPVTVTARVAAEDGSSPTGVVVFQDGAEQRRVPVDDGVAAATFDAGPAGARRVTAMFVGSTGWSPSQAETTLAVAKAPTRTTVTAPVRGSATVTVAAPGSTAVPTGPVRVTEGGRQVATATLTGGRGAVRLPALAPGRHALRVAYAGDADTQPSVASLVVTVPPAASATRARAGKVKGRRARLTVTVTGAPAATGRVEVRDGRTVVARGTVRAGRVVLRTKRLRRGRHTLRVSYLGSTALRPSATLVRVRVR